MLTDAMILTGLNKQLEYRSLELQDLSEYDVFVKILYSGVCHTQLLEARGRRGVDKFLPHCMGHEASGIVEKIGKNVTSVQVGDKVALTWIKCSGGNSGGKKHKDTISNNIVNAGPVATFAKHAIVSENKCIRVNENLDSKLTAILGCALATGYGLINRTSLIKKTEKVALVGAGGIGQSALIFLKLLGCNNVTVFDINDAALERAKNISGYKSVNSNDVKNNNFFDSFDCVIETSGSKAGSELAYVLAFRKNGRVVFAGNLSFGTKILIDPFHLLEGKKIVGCGYENSKPEIDFPIIEKFISENKPIFDNLISHVLPLKDLNEAFNLMEKGKALRVILDCSF